MKRRIALLLTLALACTAASFIRSDSVTRAQNTNRSVFDTGLISLGANQRLRVSFSAGGDSGSLVIKKLSWLGQSCDVHGVCMTAVSAQEDAGPYQLSAGEAIVIDVTGAGFTRVVTRTNIKNLKVIATIIDTTTGESQSCMEIPVNAW